MLRTDDAGRQTMDVGRWTMDAGPSAPYYKLTGELKTESFSLDHIDNGSTWTHVPEKQACLRDKLV